ncbi:MAG: hypothetical protein GX786_10840 [Clostridiales bacterium]|nr:hypothetical protein [Clostridiales bacterium]
MFFKILMFVSSYFPLYVMLIILNWENILKSTIMACVLGPLILLSLGSVYLLHKGKGNRSETIGKISRPDDVVISYIMTYIIPLMSGMDGNKATIIVNFLLYLLIGYMYIRLNLVYINPLWAIWGYIVYREESERIIITNLPYDYIKKQNELIGYYIMNDIFVAKKSDNLKEE